MGRILKFVVNIYLRQGHNKFTFQKILVLEVKGNGMPNVHHEFAKIKPDKNISVLL